jgi:hypothetical protein
VNIVLSILLCLGLPGPGNQNPSTRSTIQTAEKAVVVTNQSPYRVRVSIAGFINRTISPGQTVSGRRQTIAGSVWIDAAAEGRNSVGGNLFFRNNRAACLIATANSGRIYLVRE